MPKPTKPRNVQSRNMGASGWGKLRSYLAQHGYSQAWINQQIGSARTKIARAEIATKLLGVL